MMTDDRVTALEARVAELEQAVADLRELHTGELRAERVILADADGAERVTLAIEEGNGGQREVVLRDLYAAGKEVLARWELTLTPAERETGREQDATNTEWGGALKRLDHRMTKVRFPLGAANRVLEIARSVMKSDFAELEREVPPLEEQARAVRLLLESAGETWPQGQERLALADRMIADARTTVARCQQRLAEQEARRRRRVS